ncbi:MAG: glycosyltransferase N-terminal domain-containing protein, partial [Candidatus Paceibacterota bacterium]
MRLVYQIIILSLSILLYPWLKINKKTRLFLAQRYGCHALPSGEYYWFHGASLGEIQGLLPIIKLLRQEKPTAQILGTATSVNGYKKMLEVADLASLLPIDHPIYIKRFLAKAKIKKFIFGETEIWPELIHYLFKNNVNCYLVNGRLSEFNFKKYLFFKKFIQKSLIKLTGIFCISETYLSRFVELGACPSKAQVTGNLKYDQAGKLISAEEAQEYRWQIFKNDLPIFTIASIRPGEEEYFSDIIKQYQDNFNI